MRREPLEEGRKKNNGGKEKKKKGAECSVHVIPRAHAQGLALVKSSTVPRKPLQDV